MRKRIRNKLSRLLLLLLVFVFFTASTSICVEASWVDRDGSGIYEGEIDGGIDEDVHWGHRHDLRDAAGAARHHAL